MLERAKWSARSQGEVELERRQDGFSPHTTRGPLLRRPSCQQVSLITAFIVRLSRYVGRSSRCGAVLSGPRPAAARPKQAESPRKVGSCSQLEDVQQGKQFPCVSYGCCKA